MQLSKALLIIQNDLMNYISDRYIDVNSNIVQGQNKLNEALKEYNISFAYSLGTVDKMNNNLVWVMFENISTEIELIGEPSFNDTITISINAIQVVNTSNSLLSFNVVNSVIQDMLREWFFNFRHNEIAIRFESCTSEQSVFYFSDNTVNDFNSINSVRYTNKITFNTITFKE